MTGKQLKQFAKQRWGKNHALMLGAILRKHQATVYRMYAIKKINYLVEEKIKQIVALEKVE